MPYTLLRADDSVTIQRVIELTFADEDVTVIAVSDGDQAIERMEASPPDIVLADIGMPGKNGYEVARYIRQSPRLSHIPVVLLTGAFEPVDQARANEAGCDGVLAKPFEPQLVISRVKELLARGHHGPDAPGLNVPRSDSDAADLALPSASDSVWASPLNEQQRPATPFLAQQRPAHPLADQPIAAAATAPAPRTELNDYFDRLDAAFSTMSSPAGQTPAPARSVAEPKPPVPFEIDTNIDWFGTKGEGANAEPWDLPAPPVDVAPVEDFPLSYAPAVPDAPIASRHPSPPFAPEINYVVAGEPEPVVAVAHAAEPNPPPLPALADAFAALLAAEHADPDAAAAGLWPAGVPQSAAVSEELIEDVTRRVLERLSDTVVFREAVAETTAKIADQLVREEIAHIKASIR